MRADAPTVVTPTTSRNLATIATVRLECDIADYSEDRQLAMWLRQASGMIEQRCDPIVVRETFQQKFTGVYTSARGDGSPGGIVLWCRPNVVIDSVVEDGVTLTDGDDYDVVPESGLLFRCSAASRVCWNADSVVVVYAAGYTPGDDLPIEIERAAVILTKQFRFAAGRDPMASNIEIANAGSTRYFGGIENPTGLSPEVEGLLSDYMTSAVVA